MAVLIGTSAVGTNGANSNLTNTAFGVRLQCGTTGTVTKILVRSSDSTSMSTRHGALYADNAGQLSGATRLSGDITTPVLVSGWHEYTLGAGVSVAAGTFYWLQFVCTSGVYNYTDNAASGGTTRDTTGQSTLTNPAATTTSSFTNQFNAYADGTTGQEFLPDADTVTTGWTATPLYSKLNDGSDATVVTATLA